MNDIHLPIGTKVWPVVSTDYKPDIRFPRKYTTLTESGILPAGDIYRVPASPRFKFFQDGDVNIKGIMPFHNEPGKYAYYEFPEVKRNESHCETVHGFIFNIHRCLKESADTKWELKLYFENEIRHEQATRKNDIDGDQF